MNQYNNDESDNGQANGITNVGSQTWMKSHAAWLDV